VETEIIESSGGVFEVEAEGKLIFSKKSLGRFPEPGEIEGIVKGIKDGA
jgi:selenoprotein W-related protein